MAKVMPVSTTAQPNQMGTEARMSRSLANHNNMRRNTKLGAPPKDHLGTCK